MTPSGAILNRPIAIERRSDPDPAPDPRTDYDDWNPAPTVGTDWEVASTVWGRIRTLTADEVSDLADQGVETFAGRAWLERGSDVRVGDRLTLGGRSWSVRGVRDDPGGTDAYVVAELARVDE